MIIAKLMARATRIPWNICDNTQTNDKASVKGPTIHNIKQPQSPNEPLLYNKIHLFGSQLKSNLSLWHSTLTVNNPRHSMKSEYNHLIDNDY